MNNLNIFAGRCGVFLVVKIKQLVSEKSNIIQNITIYKTRHLPATPQNDLALQNTPEPNTFADPLHTRPVAV
jgi:hypothetical protein